MKSNYISSEKFIHDELIRRAARAVQHIPTLWKKYGRAESSVIFWPADSIKVEGREFAGAVYSDLPAAGAERDKFLLEAVGKVKPYGIFVVEQFGKERIRAIFESHHGTRSWSIPIKKHGDVYVLGSADSKDNAEHLGLLWSPRQGTA